MQRTIQYSMAHFAHRHLFRPLSSVSIVVLPLLKQHPCVCPQIPLPTCAHARGKQAAQTYNIYTSGHFLTRACLPVSTCVYVHLCARECRKRLQRRLRVHRRIHGAQRRPVHGVRGGNVQGGVWRGILHGMSGRLDVACRCYMRWHALEALCLFALMLVDGHVCTASGCLL